MGEVVTELDLALRLQVKEMNDLRISLTDIQCATNNFSHTSEIQKYESGTLYRGEVSNYKGRTTAAIMRFSNRSYSFRGFISDVELLFNRGHENIISVVGFCDDGGVNIIVYEYASRGSLAQYLDDTDNIFSLSWMQHLKICISCAHVLNHLHDSANQHMLHRNINSNNVLINENWDAKVFGLGHENFSIGSLNQRKNCFIVSFDDRTDYTDPESFKTGVATKESDVYSLGVVLFEILCGKPTFIDGCRPYISTWVQQSVKSHSLRKIIKPNILKQTGPKSIKTFTNIAYRCLKHPDERPGIGTIVAELEKALIFQEMYEWEHKLPTDYKEIIRLAKYPVVNKNMKELYYILFSGILLNNGHWFSLNEQGKNCEMVPATNFSYNNHKRVKWKALAKSRFPKVAKMFDLSNLKLQVEVQSQFLSSEIKYAAYLVFKFCDRKKITAGPIYVELKYKVEEESKIAYFAEWRGNGWMQINLCYVPKENVNAHFKVLLEGMSSFYCGSGAIYVEGIEFLPIENVGIEGTHKFEGENNVESLWKTGWEFDLCQQLPTDHRGLIKRSKNHVINAENNVSSGFLAVKGKVFFDSQSFPWRNVDGSKCHMLPARAILFRNPSTRKRFKRRRLPISRFEECVEILSYHEFCLRCKIGTQMLTPNTAYACYLVYTISEKCRGLQSPIKARNLLPRKKKETTNIYPKKDKQTINVYLRSPNPENATASVRHPRQRKDGWMEVVVLEFNFEVVQNRDHIPLNIKLITLEGNMAGLILYGIEFRPRQNCY